jgi:hypothetical protein
MVGLWAPAAAVWLSCASTPRPPQECQPKVGIHRWQPQFHVIAPMFPGKNGTRWPGGVNDANAVWQLGGVGHIMHQCDGGPAGVPCGGGWEGPNTFVTRESPCTCILKNSSRGRTEASHMFSGGINASAGQCWHDDDHNYLDSGHIGVVHVPNVAACCDACHQNASAGCAFFTCVADSPPSRAQTYFHSWGHVVSRDMAHWARIADALVPNVTDYEHGADCDGSVSFPNGRGAPPIMLFGPGCGFRGGGDGGGGVGGGLGLGDAARVGLATPASSTDPLLTHWRKDPQNPLTFSPSSPPCSFAGRVWRGGGGSAGEHWSLLCSQNGTRARYTTPYRPFGGGGGGVAALHGPWSLADRDFGDGKLKWGV